MKKIVIVIVLSLYTSALCAMNPYILGSATSTWTPAPDTYTEKLYVTQSGAGDHNGSSVGNAWSLAEFNTAGNWGVGVGKISPDDIVYFSGTITSQTLPAGSGTSGNPITLDGTDAILQFDVNAVTHGMLKIDGQSYLTVQNWTVDGTYTTGARTISWGMGVKGTNSSPSSNIIFDNNEIYEAVSGIVIRGDVSYVTITDGNFHDLNGNGIKTTSWLYEESGGSHTTLHPRYITIGGSSGSGNTFDDVGYYDGISDANACVGLDRSEDVIVSYNYCKGTTALWGMAGIYGNDAQRVLVEYNIFHDLKSENHRAGIDFKGDINEATIEGDYVIRYNHVYNCFGDDNSWGTSTAGINLGYDWQYAYVYGNYIHDTGYGISHSLSWDGGTPTWYDNDKHIDNSWVFSNIIADTQHGGFRMHGWPGSGYDDILNVILFNNTFYKCTNLLENLGVGYASSPGFADDSTVTHWVLGAQLDYHTYKNNLIIQSRPNNSDYIAMTLRTAATNASWDYNHFYDSRSSNIIIREQNESSTDNDLAWNSGSRSNYGNNSSEGNPTLTDPANGDFTLTGSSGLVDPGEGTDMGSGNIATVTIQGTGYPIPWDFALGDGTVFHATDPDSIVIEAKSMDVTGWPIGAYVE